MPYLAIMCNEYSNLPKPTQNENDRGHYITALNTSLLSDGALPHTPHTHRIFVIGNSFFISELADKMLKKLSF